MNSPDISIADLPLRFEVADSVVEQFALSHSPTDVLRELVQNEYDSGGNELGVHFSSDRLVITGNGKPIDAAGWRRLSVMLGTGRVPNSQDYVAAKESSIGSKNFGLRSLFTVGDEIWVTSGGKWSVLHCHQGALHPPREAQDSPNRGVSIEVPYRSSRTGALEPFSLERRSAWVEELRNSLARTLIKLANPGRSQSLRRVVLTSEDGPLVSWEQRAREDPAPARGIRLVRRTAVQEIAGHKERLVELEFQAKVRIPAQHRHKDFPAYFNCGRNQLRIGVSLKLDRGRPDGSSVGLAFYPLGAPLARTGNLVSLNAPFDLDNNRANIISPLSSSWNEWLIRELVELTVRLLTEDWYERFGAGAYLALEPKDRESSTQLIDSYANAVVEHLSSGNVWPTRRRYRGKVKFAAASTLALPDKPEFDGFFEPENYLDTGVVTNARMVKFASDCGAVHFGPDSLIRLRCAGEDASSLRTRPQDKANWYFVDFDRRIRQLSIQIKFAEALEKTRLTANHKVDVSDTVTTLAADGSLHALSEPLQVVPPDSWQSCPVPLSQRLHPDLAKLRALGGLAKKYDMNGWIRSTALRAQERKASDEERRNLMEVILARKGKFDSRTLGVLRKSPVLLDHRGNWVEPRKITFRTTKGARALEPVLNFPATSYAKDTELGNYLSFRTEVDGKDLVNLAEWVGTHPEKASQLEGALLRFHRLVRPALWRRLREIECLRSSNGSLAAPQNLYVRTSAVMGVLGDHVAFVEGANRALYERLGCNTLPRSQDIVSEIEQNRRSGIFSAETLYIALVEALRRERLPVKAYANEAIVWTEEGYSSPAKTLVRPNEQGLFPGAVPVARPRSFKATEALKALGCRPRPVPEDWVALIDSISESVGTDGIVSNFDRVRLLRGYAMLRDGVPDAMRLSQRTFILGRDRRLHAPSSVFVDDFPQLAERLGTSVPIAEDSGQAAVGFYSSCGVRRLSEAAQLSRTQVGSTQDGPSKIGATKTRRQLDSPIFQSGLVALINREISDYPRLDTTPLLANQLPRVQSLTFVDAVSHEYELDGNGVTVPANHHWEGSVLYVVLPKSRTAFRDVVSYALAESLTGSPRSAQMLGPAIYRLLECNSTEEIADFLANRGIPWGRDSATEVWETESDWNEVDMNLDNESIAGQIGDSLTTNLVRRASSAEAVRQQSANGGSAPSPKPKDRTLPALDEVVTHEIALVGAQISAGANGSRVGMGGGGWSPRDPEWDRSLGERGEEIVYRHELERVRKAGYESPESLVTWVARDDPTADHDIRSVGEDGGTLWIEVKSTSGLDGNFEWPESEVARAMAERERYVLCRVYRADSTTPLVKRFIDPLSMIETGHIRLGLGSVRAQVESARTGQDGES